MNPTLIDERAAAAHLPAAELPRLRDGFPAAAISVTWSWWLWPHLLSLDAPLVALVWQRWWARVAGVTLPPSRVLILGLGVWLIYLADRLADAAVGRGRDGGAVRHWFSGRFRCVLLPAAGGLAFTLVILTLMALPGAEFRSGMGVLALALGYFGLIHFWSGRGWSTVVPKEAAVGGMFSVGTVFFIACRSPHPPPVLWIGSGLFAAVCFLNCALITTWERHESDRCEPSSLLNAFPRFSSRLCGACVLLAAVALMVSAGTLSWTTVPVAISALLLAGLDRCAPRLSTNALRVLADAVLLTPLCGLACGHPVS